MKEKEIREELEKLRWETPADPKIYDFKTRLELAQRHWKKMLKELSGKGYDKEKTSFKIVSSGEALKITFSPEITRLLNEFWKKAEEIATYDQIRPKKIKIVKNSIITTGNDGLSQTSILLNLVCADIENRLNGKMLHLREVKKEMYGKIRYCYKRIKCCRSISIKIETDKENIFEDNFSVKVSLEFHPRKPLALPNTMTFLNKDSQEIIKKIEEFTELYLKENKE